MSAVRPDLTPRAVEVYCVTCPTCGVEWSMRWPPDVGSRRSACGHIAVYRSPTGYTVVYEMTEDA